MIDNVRKRRKNRTTKSPAQLRIEIMLMEAGLSKKDIADHYGHAPSNVTNHMYRENVSYFTRAIKEINNNSHIAPTG